MNYGGILPVTGGVGVLAGGYYFGLDDVVAAAIALVLLGVAVYRFASRIGKGRTTVLIGTTAVAVAAAVTGHVVGGVTWPAAVAIAAALAIALLWAVSSLVNRLSLAVA